MPIAYFLHPCAYAWYAQAVSTGRPWPVTSDEALKSHQVAAAVVVVAVTTAADASAVKASVVAYIHYVH